MTDLYEENLWDKVDYLHERYQREHNHISNFLNMMALYQNACLEFSKQITNILNKNYILAESNTSSLYKSMESFYKSLLLHSKSFKETYESIKINLMPVTKSITESFQKEKDMYNSYIKARNIHNNNKSYLDKIKKEFSQKSQDCENLVYEAKNAKIFSTATPEQIKKMENKATEYLTNTVLFQDKYIQNLKETNKSRENEINSQKNIQKYYHNIDIDYYGKIKMMTGFFISCLKRMFNSLMVEIEDFNETFNKINIEKDINDFVEKHKTDAKPEETIRFVPYKPAREITSNSIVNATGDDKKNVIVSYEVILVFQKLFKFIRIDLNMEEEKKKNRLRLIVNKIFSPKDNICLSQNEINDLFSYFKQQKFRSFFIILLSKDRSKGFKKNEKLKNDLIDIFSNLLEYAEKENDLDLALNCIILCQTFYYEKINKFKNTTDKKYLIEGIKDNKWLNTIEFWEGVINLMIKKEVENNDDIKKNIGKEKKNSFNKIVYAQILNYTNTMLEFNIKKDDIITLVQNISNKCQLKKEDCDSIIKNIKDKDKKNDILEKLEKKIKENKKKEEKEELKVEGEGVNKEVKEEKVEKEENEEKKDEEKEKDNEKKEKENNINEKEQKEQNKEEKEEKDEKEEKEEK